MVCGPTGHLVGSFVLEKDGASYSSRVAFNTVASIDDWSAPIMAEVGPDGNVWILDWYNYIVQHNPTPNGFQTGKGAAYESDLRDKRFARVYRLVTDEAGDGSPTRTLQLADAKQRRTGRGSWVVTISFGVERHSDCWSSARRLTTRRLVLSFLLVHGDQVDEIGLNPAAMHAIWTLAGLSEAGSETAAVALAKACTVGFGHVSSPVRNAAISELQ